MSKIRILAIFAVLLSIALCTINVKSPPQLAQLLPNGLKLTLSPIGFRPLSGRLDGRVILANPSSACSKIKDVHDQNENIFVFADDTSCLESIKAKNIANSGGYAGIIKMNINNTLHDKEINLVHIPIIELQPEKYDIIVKFIKQNPTKEVSLILQFSDKSQTHLINYEIWFSPTEIETYQFLLQLKDFITSQNDKISFQPHYVLQSQRQIKNYVGCLSSGRYCPTQIQFEGKYEGKMIVEQILRQRILWKISSQIWWKYINSFYITCLKDRTDVFMLQKNLYFCSQNSLIVSGVDLNFYKSYYNSSFIGTKKEIDDNIQLSEQRQHYIREQISSHPIGLINKKEIKIDAQVTKQKMCKMQIGDISQACKGDHNLTTQHIIIFIAVLLIIFVAIAAGYRFYMHIRMKKEIKSEVDKTLEQYYRYMDTFQGKNGQVVDSRKFKISKQKSRPLTQQLQEYNQQKQAENELKQIKNQK